MSLQNFKIETGKSVQLVASDNNADKYKAGLHITQIALLNGPKNVPVEIYIQKNTSNTKFLLATLENPIQRQFQCKLFIDCEEEVECSVKCTKNVVVHITGFSEPVISEEEFEEDDFDDMCDDGLELKSDSSELQPSKKDKKRSLDNKEEPIMNNKKMRKNSSSSENSSDTEEDTEEISNPNVDLEVEVVQPGDETSSESTEVVDSNNVSNRTAGEMLEPSSSNESSSDESSSDEDENPEEQEVSTTTLEAMLDRLEIEDNMVDRNSDSDSDSDSDSSKSSSAEYGSSEDSEDSVSLQTAKDSKKSTSEPVKKESIAPGKDSKKSKSEPVKKESTAPAKDSKKSTSAPVKKESIAPGKDSKKSKSEPVKKESTAPAKDSKKSKSEPVNKQSKETVKDSEKSTGDKAIEEWVNNIAVYLKANGKCKVAMVGSKVEKPQTVPKTEKLTKVLNASDKFTVSSGFVELC